MDVLQWSRHYRCFPGQGALDVAGFAARVLATGYSGPLSLEVFNDVFRQADPCRTAVDAMRSLILLEDAPLPPPAQLDGFAFVEIGVDSPETEDLLRAMGFAHVGPHRTKPVQLFEHGDLRVVLNHGSSDPEVVAIAVASEDPDASAARAEALLAPRVERRRGAGEADLTAVAAPDGTAVFFCGPDWLNDFLPTGESGGDGVPIERIDHITLAQPFEAFDEAGLFYRSVLDLQPSDAAELAAPDGLVRSRAYASGDVRVVLNVPALASTRDRTELQHVAFSCADALATARAMRERGVPLLAVPEQLLRRPGGAARASTPRRCGSSGCSTTARPRESSCTSTRPASAGACSSRCSSAVVATRATAPSTHPSAWPRKPEERDMQKVLEAEPVKTGRFTRARTLGGAPAAGRAAAAQAARAERDPRRRRRGQRRVHPVPVHRVAGRARVPVGRDRRRRRAVLHQHGDRALHARDGRDRDRLLPAAVAAVGRDPRRGRDPRHDVARLGDLRRDRGHVRARLRRSEPDRDRRSCS